MIRISIFVVSVLILACNSTIKKSISLKLIWEVSGGLVSPESVMVDSVRNCLYVSNSREYDFTGRGYISKYDLNGNLIDSIWVSGLNRPTGMAIFGSSLYVADIDKLISINLERGNVIGGFLVEGDIPGFNDVVADENGNVYVTASNFHGIYRPLDSLLQPILIDTKTLKWANGIILKQDQLVVAGFSLNKVNLSKMKTEPIQLNNEIMDFDGIQLIRNSEFLLSSAGAVNKLWHIDSLGNIETLLSGNHYFGDFFISENRLYMPTGNHQTGQYRLQCFEIIYQ